jgi:hypothetical protein
VGEPGDLSRLQADELKLSRTSPGLCGTRDAFIAKASRPRLTREIDYQTLTSYSTTDSRSVPTA